MRIELLLSLLEAERLKTASNPETKVSKSVVGSILYMGLSDEDLIKHAVPKIIAMERIGKCSKDDLKTAILEHPNIKLLPNPIRHAVNDSVEQRRMDSLSRLLSLDTKYTPCVAVTFYNGELIASSNAPNPKEPMTDDELSDCLVRKMEIIQNFLTDLIKDIPVGSQPNLTKIQFSTRAKLLAMEAVMNMIQLTNGGVGEVVPTTQDNRHDKRKNTVSHLQNALLKLGQHCLLGTLTNGKKGFKLEEIGTLLSESITIVTPNTDVLEGKQLHAEQAILYYLREYTTFGTTPSAKVHLGISKLCCQACHTVLNKEDKSTYRGTHGMKFPSVLDIDSGDLYQGATTKLGADLCPEDSDSDCDSCSDSEDSVEIPTVEELLKDSKKEILTQSQCRLFKPYKPEIKTSNLSQPVRLVDLVL
ncbi:hypothetical protein [uncultured Legionella sp.]|uniref:hypothetical protein n=1 Tax=uncultured Legionella sp. TaxID=210934 RepID=UPI002615CA69|nr:hypothetical protein [uncultured Legionella sp.]